MYVIHILIQSALLLIIGSTTNIISDCLQEFNKAIFYFDFQAVLL